MLGQLSRELLLIVWLFLMTFTFIFLAGLLFDLLRFVQLLVLLGLCCFQVIFTAIGQHLVQELHSLSLILRTLRLLTGLVGISRFQLPRLRP